MDLLLNCVKGMLNLSKINNNDIVLFQGDSVTDCGRNRNDTSCLGNGYAKIVSDMFTAKHPESNVTFLNKGISGNRVKDLQSRWREDCLELRPNWVSILIGINDCWRRYDSNDPTSVDEFASGYRTLLEQIKHELQANVILCEPFLLPVPEDRKLWREDLDPKIHAVRELAREFGALYIPLDGLFAEASTRAEPSFWLPDGVHPSQDGHDLIAQAWLKAVDA
jgi:acyl-CoA thioesterase-1